MEDTAPSIESEAEEWPGGSRWGGKGDRVGRESGPFSECGGGH